MSSIRDTKTQRKSTVLAVAAVVLAGVTPCLGDVMVPVTNPSFEIPQSTGIVSPTGWVTTGGVGSYNPYESGGGDVYYAGANPVTDPANGGPGYPGIDGEMLAYAFETAPGSGLSQQLGATLQAGTSYTLSVDELRRNGSAAAPTLGTEIELLAGTTVIAIAIDNTGPAPGGDTDLIAVLINSDTFAGLIGQQLSISIQTTLPFTVADQATDWDNVRLTSTAVPEPDSTFLLLAVVAMVGVLLRRKTKASC